MPNLVEIVSVVLEKKFLGLLNLFLLFHYYLLLEKGVALHLYKLESPSPKNALYQFWLKLVSGSGEENENVKSLRGQRTNSNQKSSLDRFFSST